MNRQQRLVQAAGDGDLALVEKLLTTQFPGLMRAAAVDGTAGPAVDTARMMAAKHGHTEVVDALESRGLVQRRPDPDDRRATLVELTEHGASVLQAIRGTEAERVFGRLSPADRAHLARILRKLRD